MDYRKFHEGVDKLIEEALLAMSDNDIHSLKSTIISMESLNRKLKISKNPPNLKTYVTIHR